MSIPSSRDLRALFPTASELPSGWTLQAWWSATCGTEETGLRRVYLNGGGTDDELRFLVLPPGDRWRSQRALWPDCSRCKGSGRVKRPAHAPGFLFTALAAPGEAFDPVDEDGLRRCDALNCDRGKVEPIYGAANSRIRVPNFPPDLFCRAGERGLSSPTKAEVLRVMAWCDDLVMALRRRRSDERYP